MEKLYQKEEAQFNFETEWLPKDSPEYLSKRYEFLEKCLGSSVVELIKLQTLKSGSPATILQDLIKNLDSAFNCMYRGGVPSSVDLSIVNQIIKAKKKNRRRNNKYL